MQRQLTWFTVLTVTTASSTLLGGWWFPPAVTAYTRPTTECGAKPIQFQPGQRIEVVVQNRTQSPILMGNTRGARPIKLMPGQKINFYRGGSTNPNLSVAFWEATETPIKALTFATQGQSPPNRVALRPPSPRRSCTVHHE
jgi:hypothetical protein